MRLKRNLKTTLLSALMISCMGPSALLAEEKKTATREEKIGVMGAIMVDALPYMTHEEEKALNQLLKSAWKRMMDSEGWNSKKKEAKK